MADNAHPREITVIGLWKSYAAHRKVFALRRRDLDFFTMRAHGIFGVFGYIATALAATFCLILGGQWFWSMPWSLIAVEFVMISVAILGFGVAGLDTWGRLDDMWRMKHDPVFRRKQEEWHRELAKWLGETEWMVDATHEINELAASCREGADGVKRGRERSPDGGESGPKLRVVGISDVT